MKVDHSQTDDEFVTKPVLKRLFERRFGRDLIFAKQGFSGFPNEAGRKIVGKKLYKELQKIGMKPHTNSGKTNSALEWKCLNAEIFLNEADLN